MALVALLVPLFCPPVNRLERSWTPPGPKKKYLDRLLAALEKFPRHFSAKKKSLERLLAGLRGIPREVLTQIPSFLRWI